MMVCLCSPTGAVPGGGYRVGGGGGGVQPLTASGLARGEWDLSIWGLVG